MAMSKKPFDIGSEEFVYRQVRPTEAIRAFGVMIGTALIFTGIAILAGGSLGIILMAAGAGLGFGRPTR
jgi:hypothetical protein